ncbi:MAG: 16S rRNA (guanine(966)-N(2))-methyltransferase RsmD [Acidobacteriota bacterium]
MRIVAGSCRGRKLQAPKGDLIRPTADRVREAVFSIIARHIAGARVLDLFAGTGALGLEALSRGAAGATFVDQSPEALKLIGANIELCRARDRARIERGEIQQVLRRLTEAGAVFDLIFMDPPYGKGYVEKALGLLGPVADHSALVVAEHHVKDAVPEQLGDWRRTQERRYGDTAVSFFVMDDPVRVDE